MILCFIFPGIFLFNSTVVKPRNDFVAPEVFNSAKINACSLLNFIFLLVFSRSFSYYVAFSRSNSNFLEFPRTKSYFLAFTR